MSAPEPKQIFLLQGPLGSFFGYLSQRLRASGYSTLDVCFNLGDRLYRKAPDQLSFRGSPEAWRTELTRLCRLHRPQCFIMFGDRRPVHIVACDVAKQLGIKVYSFEEGYLRPDYVTFEPGGNNARSSIVDALPGFVEAEWPAAPRPVGKSFSRMARRAVVYQWALAFGHAFSKGYVHHRHRRVIPEALLWTRAYWRKVISAKADAAAEARLKRSHDKKYFVVALQVHDDLQGIHHGAGWTQESLIVATIRSFARHAPEDARLVIRYHPMDRGHVSYGALVDRHAKTAGVSDRVLLMYNGHGPSILTHAAGFISVNSTMALSAMHHNCPVFALGDCFYRMPGLTAPGRDEAALDAFWSAPPAVDLELYTRFRALLAEKTQVNGNFYLKRFYPAMAVAVAGCLARDGVPARRLGSAIEASEWADTAIASGVPAE